MLYRQKYFGSFGIRVHVRVCWCVSVCVCVVAAYKEKSLE